MATNSIEPTQVQLRRATRIFDVAGAERDLAKIKDTPYDVHRLAYPDRLAAAQNNLTRRRSQAGQEALDKASYKNDVVIFKHTPAISESREAEYVDSGLPGESGILIYTVTNNRRFTINAKFVSRSVTEATANYLAVNLLRSWLLPIRSQHETFGSPPLLKLSGYGTQFYEIPVQLSSFSIAYPDDVDYINCGAYSVPIIQSIDISLIESHDLKYTLSKDADGNAISQNATSGNSFDLAAFKVGNLRGW
jgi:hypothetical protein